MFQLEYDKLIIGVGAENNTFGIPGVKEHTHFLRQLADARAIQRRIIECFERASIPTVPTDERKRLLNFVIVGGGPTGVEFATELSDFFWEDLNKYYPTIPVSDVRITLLEAGKTILNAFNSRLVERAMKSIRMQGIDIRTEAFVKEVKKDVVVMTDGSEIKCGLIVWNTGISPLPLVSKLPTPKSKSGRILVNHYFQLPDYPEVYAVGDCAQIDGMPLPATGAVAEKQGAHAAKTLNEFAQNKTPTKFDWMPFGMMTYIGTNQSLIQTSWTQGAGHFEWFVWRSVYMTSLGSLKNKLQVPVNWMRTLIWGRDITDF